MRLLDLDPSLARPAATDRHGTLHDLLDQGLRYSPEHGGGLANHLPMALAALYELGATSAQMQRFFSNESAHLVELDVGQVEGPEVAIEDWAALRGRYAALALLRAHFATALARHGRDACLREVLPRLVGGAGTSAFHGAIRVAHAVESGHDGELAFALAYWAARWIEVPAPRSAGDGFEAPEPWLDALDARLRAGEPRWRPVGRLITGRMQHAARTEAYAAFAGMTGGFRGDAVQLLDALMLAAARRYASTRNFTVLHMATGARALRVLAPWLDPHDPVPAAVWHAVAAAWLSSGVAWMPVREVGDDGPGEAMDWSGVRSAARDSADAHVIKLVQAMAQQERRMPDAAWLAAARVAVAADADRPA